MSGGKVAFKGNYNGATGFTSGIYIATVGGPLEKLVDTKTALDLDRTLFNFGVREESLSGNELVFVASFTDSSHAIYVADLILNEDGDEIESTIDGTWDGVVFTNNSSVFSDNWTDQHFGGGTTFGHIIDRADLVISVRDLTLPSQAGVRIEASQGIGPATVSLCGLQILITAGNAGESTCSSLELKVVSGPITSILAPDITVIIPSGVTTKLTDLGGGDFEIEHLSGDQPIIVEIDGVPQDLDPGEPVFPVSSTHTEEEVFTDGFEEP